MEADEPMELSIIIVNWNSKDYLQKCIKSILDSKSNIQYEIVVIDGGSFDGAGEMLKQCYPQVKFIQSDKNVGFAKANNIAFKASSGSHVLFLNPDTEVVVPAIDILFEQIQKLPKVAQCRWLGPNQLYSVVSNDPEPALELGIPKGLIPKVTPLGYGIAFQRHERVGRSGGAFGGVYHDEAVAI